MATFLMLDGTLYDTEKAEVIAKHENETMYMTKSRRVFVVKDLCDGVGPVFINIYPHELPTPEQTKRSEFQTQYDRMKNWICYAGRADLLKKFFDIDTKEA